MAAETLEERYSPEELKRLRGNLEGLRENLVSAAGREAGLRKRQVTVGRTSLGECLRQLREAQEDFLNLLEKSLLLIDRVELLREREAQRKKKKRPRTTRLVAASQDGGGGNHKTVPPGQSEGQMGGPEEQQHPQHLHPPLTPKETLPEEEGREDSGLQKSEPELEGEDQDPGDDASDQGSGDDRNRDGSECSNDDKEASDPQKSGAAEADRQPGAGGEAQDSGDAEGEEEDEEDSEDICSDEDEDYSDVDDCDEDKDKGARCDALWADMEELEQKVDIMQNVSQEELDAWNAKVEDFWGSLRDIMSEVKRDLKKKAIHLWSAVWETPLQAVAALQETLNSFLPVELTALKKESDSLRGFLQAIQSQDEMEELDDFSDVYCLQDALRHFPLEMGALYGVSLEEEDAIKQRMDAWYSALLHDLLKQGQEKVDALQEKVDAVQNISLEQVAVLKVKIGAVQKQMGALSKILLKEMMILIAAVHELSSALSFASLKKLNTLWNKAHVQVFTLKTRKGDALQELHPLWKKLDALQDALGRVPIKKLKMLKKKEKALRWNVVELQVNLWNSLEEQLQLLKDKLNFLRDELEEELDELQETLVGMQCIHDYPMQEEVGTLQKKMDALQKKIGAWQKTNAPLQEVEELMETERSSFSETLKAPEAGGSQWNPTSTSSVRTPQPPIASCVPFPVNHPVQMNNIDSVSVGQVFGAALPSSLNTLRPQKSQLPCTPVKQPPIHYPVPFPSTAVGLPPTQCQLPVGMTPLPPPAPALLSTPASLSELHPTPVAGAIPAALQVQSTSWGQTSNGSTVSSPNRASDPRMGPTSADPTTAPSCSSGSWPLAGKRPFSGVEVAEETSIALQIPETTNLNRSKTQDPQQPEEAMCAKSSEDSLADCEPTMTETEPPHKKQKMDPVERTQMAFFAQELYAAHQNYVKYVTDSITQNMEKVGDLMGKLYGPPNQANALKDKEDAKALTSTLKKALALLKCFLEDS